MSSTDKLTEEQLVEPDFQDRHCVSAQLRIYGTCGPTPRSHYSATTRVSFPKRASRLTGIGSMKSSKLFHVLSVVFGLTGLLVWALAIFAMPADGLRFGQTREVMMLCGVLSLLTAIWLVISAMHHIALAKLGQHV